MAGARGSGEDLVSEQSQPLQQGSIDDAYPLNEQEGEHFQVGGVERTLPDELQLEQLVSYIEATYDPSSEQYLALLPDRITHASMLMLGSAVDHTMPGVAFPGEVAAGECEFGAVFTPSLPTGVWAISLYDAPRCARENSWRPEVAGAAELSGTTILDLDAPITAERAAAALAYARERGAAKVALWAFGDAAEALAGNADAYVLTFPTVLPAAGAVPTLIQVATRGEGPGNVPASAKRYHSTHRIATPAESRRRVRDAADFLAGLREL